MNEDSLSEMLMNDPEKLFELLDASGSDYSGLKKLQLGKLFATRRFPELTDREFDEAAEFMFWFAYWVEREIHNDIVFVENKTMRATYEEIEAKLDSMVFGSKIQFLVDKRYVGGDDPYITLLKEVRNLRNDLAHGRLHKLVYSGYSLAHPKGQLKMISDLRRVLLRESRTPPRQ